jgi:Ca2+-binding RTX toxin-like protein
MTTYTIDANQNTISAGNGTDIFQGVGGGNDSLRGNGGNDLFNIQIGQTGLIDGGSGYDRIHLTGPGFNNELNAGLNIVGVEELIVDSTNLFASAAQLKNIIKFGVNNNADDFSIFLQGAGGTLNFSSRFTEPQDLNIEANMATSAVHITASAGDDQMIGSDFGDRLRGDKGVDTIYGGDGGDLINGGLGRDFLYGDDGKDNFVFDTALAGNVDHIGDFRPLDDSIRLDDAIFNWAGQTLGTLKANEFKVIGTGQAVDANDRILYNQNTGGIYYDADGAGGQSAVLFAIADNFSGDVPILTFQDFIII